jgi:Tol biopolymer transport system component
MEPARVWAIGVVTAGLLAGLAGPGPRAATAGVVGRVSVASNGSQGNHASAGGALSANGRFVAFRSASTSFVGSGCTGALEHIFVHDRLTRATSCASVSSAGAPGDAASSHPSVSADGRIAAFESASSNLAGPDCANGGVFIRDRAMSTTTCIKATGFDLSDAQKPAVTADGRLMAFDSEEDIAGCPSGGFRQLFLFGPATGAVTCASRTGATAGNGGSFHAAVSKDGRFIAFESDATNLTSRCTVAGGFLYIFLHDRIANTTVCVSVSTGGAAANALSLNPSINADGRFVAFDSIATNLVASGCTTGTSQIFVHDRVARVTACVSIGSGGAGSRASQRPAISADGRFVVFESLATNLVGGGCTGGIRHIFVRDRVANTTTCLSVAAGGAPGNGASRAPTISADGRIAAFESEATNLVAGDTNQASDVFASRLATGPAWLLTGPGSGSTPLLRGFDALGGPTLLSRLAYAATFRGGLSVAAGDVNGDGANEVITGAGPGGAPEVRFFAGSRAGTLSGSFLPYPSTFAGGVRVAAGDVDGDGRAEIVTAPGAGTAQPVRIFRRTPAGAIVPVAPTFFPYGSAYTGGVHVAAGDVDGDGRADIITGPGPGNPLPVRVFRRNPNGTVTPILDFLPYGPTFRGGVFVAAGDVDGDGRAEILAGPGGGSSGAVRVMKRNPNGTLTVLATFSPFGSTISGGVRVAAGDVDGDGRADIIAGRGPGNPPQVRVLKRNPNGSLAPLASFLAYPSTFTGGVFVAGLP